MPSQAECKIIYHHQVGDDLYILKFLCPAMACEARPGQFVHVKTGSLYQPLLRRPISLFDVDQTNGVISLFYRAVGEGTRWLTTIKEGDSIDVMGPLGHGFTVKPTSEKVLLVGGGIGVAPLYFLARRLLEQSCRVELWYGVNSAGQIAIEDEVERLDGLDFYPCTLDGSKGHKGLVTQVFEQDREQAYTAIYTCGPESMMAVVEQYARDHQIWGELSLEEHMACGVGACLGCARKLKNEDQTLVKICKDGPVFSFHSVDFSLQGGLS